VTTVNVDQVPPARPTLAIMPGEQLAGEILAPSRRLSMSGATDSDGLVRLEFDGRESTTWLRRNGGRWAYTWTFASSAQVVRIEAVARDQAGNETRSGVVTVRFTSPDPPARHSSRYPAIDIDCRGLFLSDTSAQCLPIVESVLDRLPQLVPSVVRVVADDTAATCSVTLVARSESMVSYERVACPPPASNRP
jgi:hypothetical protein